MHADYGPREGRERGKREDSKFDKRKEADRLGKLLLEKGADISDEEALQLLKSWSFTRNHLRKNVLPVVSSGSSRTH